jgi:hypothetical protein
MAQVRSFSSASWCLVLFLTGSSTPYLVTGMVTRMALGMRFFEALSTLAQLRDSRHSSMAEPDERLLATKSRCWLYQLWQSVVFRIAVRSVG